MVKSGDIYTLNPKCNQARYLGGLRVLKHPHDTDLGVLAPPDFEENFNLWCRYENVYLNYKISDIIMLLQVS